jgi:RNA-directed DNA polymerase
LLANVALHGLETAVRAAFPSKCQGVSSWKPLVIRYADDFIVLHEDLAVIEQVRQIVSVWLASMGLALKPSKTRITHTLHPHDGHLGFDFLGFQVRQFPVGRTHATTNRYGTLRDFKTIITPSRAAQQRHLQELAAVIRRHQQTSQSALIAHLNRLVVGWANYYSTQVSKAVFGRLDHLTYQKLKRWAERRHPNKSRTWARNRYWHTRNGRQWVFGPRDGAPLALHSETPIRRHTLVKGSASPYDGDLMYWASRLGRHPELPKNKARLLKQQAGRCAWCGRIFTAMDELIECDHIVPLAQGGLTGAMNRQLLHGHCHDVKTAMDGNRRQAVGGATVTGDPVEEPDEVKVSRPVL